MKKVIKDKNGNTVGYSNNNRNSGIEDYKKYAIKKFNGVNDLNVNYFHTNSSGILVSNFQSDFLNTVAKDGVGAINELRKIIDDLNPVGTIKINNVSNNFNPGFGTWELIGQLKDGQTISGFTKGQQTSGEVIRHRHKVLLDDWPASGTHNEYIGRNNRYNNITKYTEYTGGDHNKAYSLGIGKKYIWERVS